MKYRIISSESISDDKKVQNEVEVDEEDYTIIRSYQKISPKEGDKYKIIDCEVDVVNQSGGYCYGYSNATINSVNQSGGECEAFENATLKVTNHIDGDYGVDCTAILDVKIIPERRCQ